MDGRGDIQDVVRPAAYLPHVKASRPPAGGHAHHGPVETVREEDYYGHRIVVRTTYQIEVDGRPVSGHLGVANDGRVHYHPVPNLSYASAVDLVKGLIDAFPEDFEPGDGGPGHADHDHADHDHADHADHHHPGDADHEGGH
ncbi:MAG TPA: hypothetical protein VE465_29835 [Streptosporangiaceae bacterium]|nr:hypothetical protein [Streptosporangiaceae bacterium]